MSNGTMGLKTHPKLVTRIRELLRKNDLSIAMISERTGVSSSQIHNIKHGRESEFVSKMKRHPMQDEFNALFDSDDPETVLECPPEPEPQPKPAKRKAVVDLFGDAPPAVPKVKQITPELERRIIVDLRAEIAPNIIASRHNVPVLAVESLAERVYWLAYADDHNVAKAFTLTDRERMRALGPKLTKAQQEIVKPLMAGANQWISEVFNIDLATADTVRKVVCAYYIENDFETPPPKPPKPPKPKPVAKNVEAEIEVVVSTLFAEIEAIESDELEPLNALCMEFFGREPEPHTVAAWLNGYNDRKLKLETFEVDDQVMTTEREFRGFFRSFAT